MQSDVKHSRQPDDYILCLGANDLGSHISWR